ncbi:hypothetical protein [Streptomyces acidicola]|uniref:hypothetical protein n=1 Tax=Streptomyces acidicola TaxID=2596892 RepID=UPI0038305FB9
MTGWTRRARSRRTHTVRANRGDGEPGESAVCDGHAMAARASITNGQVVPGIPA